MELSLEEIHKTTKERVGRQRKSAVGVSGVENALTLPRRRLGLVPWEPCRFMGDQSPLNQIVEVVLANRQADPIALDLARRQAGP